MPFNVDAPMDQVHAPARYPSPDWTKPAEVVEMWLPNEPTPVGWLVIQDDMALSWLSAVGPERQAAFGQRKVAEDMLTLALQEGSTCREAFNRVKATGLVTAPRILNLPTLSARLQELWK